METKNIKTTKEVEFNERRMAMRRVLIKEMEKNAQIEIELEDNKMTEADKKLLAEQEKQAKRDEELRRKKKAILNGHIPKGKKGSVEGWKLVGALEKRLQAEQSDQSALLQWIMKSSSSSQASSRSPSSGASGSRSDDKRSITSTQSSPPIVQPSRPMRARHQVAQKSCSAPNSNIPTPLPVEKGRMSTSHGTPSPVSLAAVELARRGSASSVKDVQPVVYDPGSTNRASLFNGEPSSRRRSSINNLLRKTRDLLGKR